MSEALTHPERVAVARLQALLELLPTALDKELTDLGLTSFEYSLLETLDAADDHRLRLSTLASRTNATLPRLSRVMNALDRKGYATREPCEEDARATNAVLTDAGRRALGAARPRHTEAVRRLVLSRLDENGLDDLARLTHAILGALDTDRRPVAGMPEDACPADPLPSAAASDAGPTDPADETCPADPLA